MHVRPVTALMLCCLILGGIGAAPAQGGKARRVPAWGGP